jgi:methenyltetrahydromethanopterin cyclohydrolase
MRIELPQIYLNKTENNTSTSDTRAYLTVSRIKMNFADIGVVTTTLKRLGKPDYVELIESAVQDYYKADSIAFLPARTVTIPVYEKNKNVIIQISSTHPSPAIFNSMEWEGNITQKFYQRV